MGYLDAIGSCNCHHGEDADITRGYLGWYVNLNEVLKRYPTPRIGWSFNNVDTRSVWIYDGRRWCNTTQGNPFTMITDVNNAGSVRKSYAQTFYYIPTEADVNGGTIIFRFVVDGEGETFYDVDVHRISDIVFIEWTGSTFNERVHQLDANVALKAELEAERAEREENDEYIGTLIESNTNAINSVGNDLEATRKNLQADIDAQLSANEVLPFAGVVEDANITAASTSSTSYEVVYVTGQNVFAARVGFVYYNNWGTGSLYNEGGTARKNLLLVDRYARIWHYSGGKYTVKIDTNVASCETDINALRERIDAFLLDADVSESAKDTLRELQDYINQDATAAATMLASINQLNESKASTAELEAERTEREENDAAQLALIKFIHVPIFVNKGAEIDIEFLDEIYTDHIINGLGNINIKVQELDDNGGRNVEIGYSTGERKGLVLVPGIITKVELMGTTVYLIANGNILDENLFPVGKTYIADINRMLNPTHNASCYAQYKADQIISNAFFHITPYVEHYEAKTLFDADLLCLRIDGGDINNGNDYRIRLMRRRKRALRAGWAAVDKNCRNSPLAQIEWFEDISSFVEFVLQEVEDENKNGDAIIHHNVLGDGSEPLNPASLAGCYMCKEGGVVRVTSGYKKHYIIGSGTVIEDGEHSKDRVDMMNLGLAIYRYNNNRAIERVSNIAPIGITIMGYYLPDEDTTDTIKYYWNMSENGSRINPRGLIKFPTPDK